MVEWREVADKRKREVVKLEEKLKQDKKKLVQLEQELGQERARRREVQKKHDELCAHKERKVRCMGALEGAQWLRLARAR
jgi:hypothetical protein